MKYSFTVLNKGFTEIEKMRRIGTYFQDQRDVGTVVNHNDGKFNIDKIPTLYHKVPQTLNVKGLLIISVS